MVAKMSIQRALMFLAATALIFDAAAATTFTVGSPGGSWNTNTDLQAWASNQSFVVGDNLIFQYTLDHTVVEVTKANYEAARQLTRSNYTWAVPPASRCCSPENGTSSAEQPVIVAQGMKLEVDTVAATTPVTPPAGIPPLLGTPPVALPPLPGTPPAAFPPLPAAFLPPGIPTLTPPPAVTVSAPPPAATTPPPGSANVTSPPPRSSASKVTAKIAARVGFVSFMLLAL